MQKSKCQNNTFAAKVASSILKLLCLSFVLANFKFLLSFSREHIIWYLQKQSCVHDLFLISNIKNKMLIINWLFLHNCIVLVNYFYDFSRTKNIFNCSNVNI